MLHANGIEERLKHHAVAFHVFPDKVVLLLECTLFLLGEKPANRPEYRISKPYNINPKTSGRQIR